MSLITGGTVATTSLDGLAWNPMSAIADVAGINNIIKLQNAAAPLAPGSFIKGGQLFFPSRQGFINLVPGDYIFVDSNGWPIVVSAQSIASGSTDWAHS